MRHRQPYPNSLSSLLCGSFRWKKLSILAKYEHKDPSGHRCRHIRRLLTGDLAGLPVVASVSVGQHRHSRFRQIQQPHHPLDPLHWLCSIFPSQFVDSTSRNRAPLELLLLCANMAALGRARARPWPLLAVPTQLDPRHPLLSPGKPKDSCARSAWWATWAWSRGRGASAAQSDMVRRSSKLL